MKILAFFAHPDDETMFLGGTLAHLLTEGAEIDFLCATRGEGGEMGAPPICPRDELGDVRERELGCAVQALGGTSLRFLDYRDPLVGSENELFPYTDLNSSFVEVVSAALRESKAEIILTHGPGGEYGHPGHILTHQGVIKALSTIENYRPEIYSPCWLSRETGEFTPVPDFLLDVSDYQDQKTAAALCHRSQHGLFTRHGEARFGRPVTVPELIRLQEGLVWISRGQNLSADPLRPWLKPLLIK